MPQRQTSRRPRNIKLKPLAATEPRTGNFAVCVLGEDPFGHLLEATVGGETIDGRHVTVRRIPRADEALQCDVVFLSASERGRVASDLAILNKAPVLTVSDVPDFAARGGMIGFVLQDNRVRFEVNLSAAQKAGIALSSQLLKVAVRVSGTGRPAEGPR